MTAAILKVTPTLFDVAKAEEIAATLNADADDDWAYVVEPVGTRAYLAVIDEVGELVGYIGS